MSKLVLIHYRGKENFGMIGTKTRFVLDDRNICIGDTISYKTDKDIFSSVVIQIGDKICVYGNDFYTLDTLNILNIRRSYKELQAEETLNSLCLVIKEVKDLL